MTSKHHKWQLRWRIDQAAGLATHDTGLRVRFLGSAGRGHAENAEAVAAELAKTHGPHNAPQMLQRLLREADRLLAR